MQTLDKVRFFSAGELAKTKLNSSGFFGKLQRLTALDKCGVDFGITDQSKRNAAHYVLLLLPFKMNIRLR